MRECKRNLAIGLALASAAWSAFASAQPVGGDLMALDLGSLHNEIQTRYDAALALTQDAAVVSANNTRFVWASQAKAQCGIALGFLKSSTKDPVSIGKCDDAYRRMQIQPAPLVVLPPPPVPTRPDFCDQSIAGIIFFEFDSSTPPTSAGQTLDAVVQNMRVCGWTGLTVTGHTDRSGSDSYNNALSVRRAQAVASLLENGGIARSVLNVSGHGETEQRVPTLDGERNPQNRRVEITVK